MFLIAALIGIYSYIIFILGLIGLLYKNNVLLLCISFVVVLILRIRIFLLLKITNKVSVIFKEKLVILLIALLFLQVIINFIGSLGPELSFDALWYHLTIPKIYAENHKIFFIPGGLLYYSAMPKLTEMIYIIGLLFQNEIFAKVVHFMFGIMSLIILYKISRLFYPIKLSLLAVVIFYSNLAVAWESIASYIDLARTFFETVALLEFINWWKNGKKENFLKSAIMMGFSISTKLIAATSLIIYVVLIIIYSLINRKSLINTLKHLLTFNFISILIPLPWFIFSYVNTGSPFYPFFSSIYKINLNINPLSFFKDSWVLFTNASDPISPIYITFIPLIIFFYREFRSEKTIILLYSLLALIIWCILPRSGGGRFFLPYLPVFSVLVIELIYQINKNKLLGIITYGVVIFVSLTSIVYRGAANLKYVPVVLGKETKVQFLSNHLNYKFGDFYDTDNYFKNNITKNDKVLLYGFHNLYYVDFPYIDSSWVKKGDKFNYIAVQQSKLPIDFREWKLIYSNMKTGTELYSMGGKMWVY